MKIVFEGKSRKGKSFFIRYLEKGDVPAMQKYINTISRERTFISYQGEQLTLAEEEKFVNPQLERIEEGKCVVLLAISESKVVGVCNLDARARAERHVAGLGISVLKEFRGEGIGSKLLELTIEEGKKSIRDLEIITLGVFANNEKAIRLYKRFGFKEYGTLPRGLKLEKGYVDHLGMYLTTQVASHF